MRPPKDYGVITTETCDYPYQTQFVEFVQLYKFQRKLFSTVNVQTEYNCEPN